MDNTSFRRYLIVFGTLVLATILLVFLALPDKNLHVIACDVGQGDAILITNKSNQILIDGGPDNSVLNCLGRHLPFYDRKIEMVILTHPQADHFRGLIEVFRRYNVGFFLAPDVDSPDTQGFQVLKKEVGSRGIGVERPDTGKRFRLGLIYLDILNPSETLKSKQVNDYSIAAKLKYGNFKAIFPGDLEQNMDQDLISTGMLERVDYIKVNHHGSRNGLSEEILDIIKPAVAVISVGKDNTYGHPHAETLKSLNAIGAKILRTDQLGDVEIVSDGKDYWTKN